MTLSIVIVNHNVGYFLEQCLHSVCRAAEGLSCEVVVVDNASSDGSRGYLPVRFPGVRFVWNAENVGFGRACNQGAALSHGEYILYLNPDTIVPEDCLSRCLVHFAAHPRAGALGVRMHDGSGFFLRESKRSYPSPSTAFLKLSGLSSVFPSSRWVARYDLGDRDAFVSCRADVLAGAFLMVRRKALAVTGGFDERFFMYGEDIDLCWRLRRAGFENLYFAGAAILHFKGESNRRDSLRHVRYFYGAMRVFVRKHHSGPMVWLLVWAIGLRAGLSAVRIGVFRMMAWIRAWVGWLGFGSGVSPVREWWVWAGEAQLAKLSEELSGPGGIRFRSVNREVLFPDAAGGASAGVVGRQAGAVGQELLACPPACTYSEVLALLSQDPGRYRIRMAAEGSGGLVGSGISIQL